MMRTETEQPPRAEAPSRGATLFVGLLAAIVVLFVAGVAGLTLVWLAKIVLGV